MSHPIYGPPSHKLHRVEFVLELPARSNDYVCRVTAHGYASSKRASLWSRSEGFTVDVKNDGLAAIDLLHHLALVAAQDRPASCAALDNGLRGGASLEDPATLF